MINERKLAFKYLCKKKSRSVATLFAIVLSVFIVFVSGNLMLSSFNASRSKGLKRDGNHIAYLEELPAEKIPELEKDGAVLCALENTTIFEGLMGLDKENSRTFRFYYFEDFTKFPYYYEITQGKTPEQPGEIMLNEKWKYYLGENYEIGDTITLQLCENVLGNEGNIKNADTFTKTYTLAGYYHCPEYSWMEEQVVLVKDEPRKEGNIYRAYIISEEEGIEDLEALEDFEKKEAWAKSFENTYGTKVKVNWMFLKAESEETAMNYCMILIFSFFIGGFAAMVIRNSFVISVVERTRDYGMLRCIGASKRQIRKIAFYEAVMLGIAGEAIGMTASYLFLYLCIEIGKRHFSFMEEYELVHSPILVVGICLVIFGVVLFGLLEPTRQINKLNPLDALRNHNDVKKERFHTGGKMSRLIGKIFGVEGEYAYKNLMRNRKKFITTTLSCVVSVTFFIGINSAFVYATQLFKAEEVLYPDFNATLSFHEWCQDSKDDIKKELEGIEGVSNVIFCYKDFYIVDNESLKWKKEVPGIEVTLAIALEEEYAIKKESVEKGEVGDLKPGECYVINWGYDSEIKERVEISDVSIGDKIQIHEFVFGEDESAEKTISELEVKAVLKEQPFANTYASHPVIVVSKEGFQALCEEQEIRFGELGEIRLKIDEKCDASEVQELAEDYGMLLYDDQEWARKEVADMKMARLIVNALVILVALISSMNLFNSMESNLILREKERKIMRAIGMSHKQYRKMILLEGMLSVIIALILGTALGISFGYGIYNIMVLAEAELKFEVPVGSIVIAAVGLTLLTVLSCRGGMKKERA